jgi:hypothetical protein
MAIGQAGERIGVGEARNPRSGARIRA